MRFFFDKILNRNALLNSIDFSPLKTIPFA